jgi:hypothetical protein
VYTVANKNHVNLGFPQGAEMVIQGHDLEGTGKGMRHIKIHALADIRKPAITRLVKAAAALAKDAQR